MKFNKLIAGLTASALAAASLAVAAYAADAEGPDGLAGIAFASSDWLSQYWINSTEYATEASTVTVTGNGTYTVSVDAKTVSEDEDTGEEVVTDGANGLAFAALQIVNGESLFPGAVITIDSVTLDGVELAFTGTPYTSSDEGITTRVNLYNEWASVPDDARGAVADSTPTPLDNSLFGEWKNLTVTFTVSGAAEAPAAAAEEAAPAAGDVEAATDSSKGSPDTGIADVAAIAGIAVVAGAGIALTRKRK